MTNLMCAYDKDRVCNETCAAFKPSDKLRDGPYIWDTCLKEYVQRWNRLEKGSLCLRLSYHIGETETIKEGGKDNE